MKLFKILFVTIGAVLAAIIIIPLTVLAGLFVWLKLTEEGDEDQVHDAEVESATEPRPQRLPVHSPREAGGRINTLSPCAKSGANP